MADFHALGGVSATLRTLLIDRMEMPDGVTSIPVTIGAPPFQKDGESKKEDERINLFLYRVTENGYLQNQEIPGHGSSGAYGHPPLSLNLHYLVTAYGNKPIESTVTPPLFDELNAHYVLGSAMRVLHDVPVITDRLSTVRQPSGHTVLDEGLRGEFEKVKLTLEPLTLEDATKVWSSLLMRYRLSAAYVVNVVQIESRRDRRFPRPVGQPASATIPPLPTDPPSPGPMVFVQTIQTPTIAELRVRRAGKTSEQPFPYAAIGDTLVLVGTSLAGRATSVQIGDVVVPASLAHGDRVEVLIPDATIPGAGAIPLAQRVEPGARRVRVIANDPFVPQSASASNDVAFMLVPAIAQAPQFDPGPPRSLTITGTRLLSAAQDGEAIIGRSAVPRASYLGQPTAQSIKVPIPDSLPSANVRVMLSAPLSDPVTIGQTEPQKLILDFGGPPLPAVIAQLPASVPREQIPDIVAGLIRDAAPDDARCAGARAALCTDGTNWRLVVVAGGLTETISFSSPAPSTFASDLRLTATQVTVVGSAYLSGTIGAVPVLSSPSPRVRLSMNATTATLEVPKTMSLAALASALQSAIVATAASQAFTGAQVMVSGSQLLLIPGATATTVQFDAAPGDDRTVVELQLRARFAIRARVNGAESIDDVSVELPQ